MAHVLTIGSQRVPNLEAHGDSKCTCGAAPPPMTAAGHGAALDQRPPVMATASPSLAAGGTPSPAATAPALSASAPPAPAANIIQY